MSDLKPCPCCGSEHVETCREFWGGAAPAGSEFSDEVMCDDCGLTAPSIEAWNTRADRETELPTDPVQRFISKYEHRIEQLEESNNRLIEMLASATETGLESVHGKEREGKH